MIHVYFGDGKGKTTAATGLAVRAVGNHMKVMFVQFLKTEGTGERTVLHALDGVTVSNCPLELKFTCDMDEHEKQQTAAMYRSIFDRSAAITLSERYDMIVLDEVFDIMNEGMLAEASVFEFIRNAPNNIEIVMTGHNPPQRFIDAADYVTEFKKIKHPYDRGIQGRIGIEY